MNQKTKDIAATAATLAFYLREWDSMGSFHSFQAIAEAAALVVKCESGRAYTGDGFDDVAPMLANAIRELSQAELMELSESGNAPGSFRSRVREVILAATEKL
jgi:hypothetical protein